MSSAEAQVTYQSEPQGNNIIRTGDRFVEQFDLNDPAQAMSSYQRLMHQHTMQQFSSAEASSRRRSGDSSIASLRTEGSHGSMSSAAS